MHFQVLLMVQKSSLTSWYGEDMNISHYLLRCYTSQVACLGILPSTVPSTVCQFQLVPVMSAPEESWILGPTTDPSNANCGDPNIGQVGHSNGCIYCIYLIWVIYIYISYIQRYMWIYVNTYVNTDYLIPVYNIYMCIIFLDATMADFRNNDKRKNEQGFCVIYMVWVPMNSYT